MKVIEAKTAKNFACTFFGDPVLRMAAISAIDHAPGFDLVLCKECRHCIRDHTLDAGGDEYYYCKHEVMEHGQARPNEYCCFGERRNHETG